MRRDSGQALAAIVSDVWGGGGGGEGGVTAWGQASDAGSEFELIPAVPPNKRVCSRRGGGAMEECASAGKCEVYLLY